jgi:hypothetical protein
LLLNSARPHISIIPSDIISGPHIIHREFN